MGHEHTTPTPQYQVITRRGADGLWEWALFKDDKAVFAGREHTTEADAREEGLLWFDYAQRARLISEGEMRDALAEEQALAAARKDGGA